MSTITTPLQGALWLAERGFAVFPVDHPGLEYCAGIGVGHDPATCDQRGKHPTVSFTKRHVNTPSTVNVLFGDGTGQAVRNVGVAVGACHGTNGERLLVMDSDTEGELERVAAALGHEHTPTMRVHTAKGHHDYYWAPADLKIGNRLGGLQGAFHGDVRSGNGYVISVGSLHATGVVYSLADEDQAPVPAPQWLLDQLLARTPRGTLAAPIGERTIDADTFLAAAASGTDGNRVDSYTRAAVARECQAIMHAPDGDQNNTINRAAFSVGTLVGAGAIGEEEARQALADAARIGHHPDGRATTAIISGLTAGIASPRSPWPPEPRQRHLRAVPAAPPAPPSTTAGPNSDGATALAPHREDGWAAPEEPPLLLPVPMPKRDWDDIGNAERVVDRFGSVIRWITDTEQWAVYEGGRWSFKGANTGVWTRVVATIMALLDEASNYSEDPPVFPDGYKPSKEEQLSERQRFEKWARAQRMRPKLAAAREVLQAQTSLHVHMDHFDRPELLLNVANGIVDLSTGELHPHNRALYLMQQSSVPYRPGAAAPMWADFLASVMPDEERRAYLARVVGYTLTASTEEQVMFIHHGDGQNGKGVFMRVLMALLGDYAQSVPRSTLLAKQGDGIPNDVARMVGKRLLATTETSAGKRLDDELVKQLTGEDTMSARFMRAEFFDFRPVGKIHLATNYLPNVGGGHGIARRLQDIGWDVTVPPGKRIPKLDEKILAAEASGVLNWAIAGCLEWQAKGLAVPESVQVKTREHIANSDPLVMWMDEQTSQEKPEFVCDTAQLYANYKLWSESSGMRPMSIKAFSIALKERGIENGKDSKTRRSVTYGLRATTLTQGGW